MHAHQPAIMVLGKKAKARLKRDFLYGSIPGSVHRSLASHGVSLKHKPRLIVRNVENARLSIRDRR